ncbi:MAG: PqqD family protein [Lachnospirales bacterium]
MKIKDGYLLREVAGSHIVVPIGEGSMDFSGVISLNEVGAFLWNRLENDCEVEDLVSAILSEYDIDRETAKSDIEEFINKLKGADLLG